MLCGKHFLIYILSSFICLKPTTVNGLIDPITGTFAVGAFVAGYFINKSNFIYPYFASCPNEIDVLSKIKNHMKLILFL